MRLKTFGCRLLLSAMIATLAACQQHSAPAPASNQPGADSPQAAAQLLVDQLKGGNFASFWQQQLPPADYAMLRADFPRLHQQGAPITAQDRARFNQALQQLTAPNAETRLYQQLRPLLSKYQQQYSDQIPIWLGIGQAIVTTAIEQDKTLPADQKQQLRDALNVLLPWAQQAPWFDQQRAQKGVAIVVGTTRALGLKSPEQVRDMDFDTAMKTYSAAYVGLRQLLALYGLSLDDSYASAKVNPLSSQGGKAQVKIDYTLTGKPLSATIGMSQVDGRWFDQDLIDYVHNQHLHLQQAAAAAAAASSALPESSTVAPASAGSAPAPASSAATH